MHSKAGRHLRLTDPHQEEVEVRSRSSSYYAQDHKLPIYCQCGTLEYTSLLNYSSMARGKGDKCPLSPHHTRPSSQPILLTILICTVLSSTGCSPLRPNNTPPWLPEKLADETQIAFSPHRISSPLLPTIEPSALSPDVCIGMCRPQA